MAVLLLLVGACGSSTRPTTAPIPRSTTSVAGAAFREAITTTATSFRRILDEDLNRYGDLLVPENRYNEDIEKLSMAVGAAEAGVTGAALTGRPAADVNRWLKEASNLVALLQHSPHDTRMALQRAASDMAVVQRDLGLAP
jgi:hypothetical protein